MAEPEIAYTASDGTKMVQIAPHSVVNRCAFENHQHRWSRVSGKAVCSVCGQRDVAEVEHG